MQSRFSPKEKEVLVCIQHRADLTIPAIAKVVDFREHTVRYIVSKLIEQKAIVRRAHIDLYRLGYSKHAFFFALTSMTDGSHKEVTEYLLQHPQIAYVAEVGGDYRFKVDICTQTQSELKNFLTGFAAKFGEILRDKAFVQLVDQIELGVRCLCKRRFDVIQLKMGISDSIEKIDAIDHRILAAISEISESSFADIARTLGLSQSLLQYRLDALRKKKILLGFRYVVNGKLLGLSDYYHLLYVKGMSESLRERILKFCVNHPSVRYFVPCIGSWDFEIGSNVENHEDAAELSDKLFQVGGESIARIQTLPLFRFSKVSNYPLLN